jgi:hypothetical protein
MVSTVSQYRNVKTNQEQVRILTLSTSLNVYQHLNYQKNISSMTAPVIESEVNKKSPTNKKDFKSRYRNISQSEWFKEAYEGKTLGDVLNIES